MNYLLFSANTYNGDIMVLTNELLKIIIRSILIIVILFFITKILGKKQISQLTIYDYIIGITIGSIAADTIISLDENLINGLAALLTFGVLGYGLSYLSIKNSTIDEFLNGKYIVLIKNGEINFTNLKKSKLSINKLMEQARLEGYYDLNIINYAILETDGQISFLPKEEYQNSNTKDFKNEIKTNITKQTMCYPFIIDGEIVTETLNNLNKDIDWVKKEIKNDKIEKILLATIDEKNKIKIYK